MIWESDIIFEKQKQKRTADELESALAARGKHACTRTRGCSPRDTHVRREDGWVPALQHRFQLIVSGGLPGWG